MPIVNVGTEGEYYLIEYDERGLERPERDGSLLSGLACGALKDAARGYTHVAILSHGWKADVPAARAQYDAWLAVARRSWAASQGADRGGARGAKLLVVGVHWPSLPWGDEEASASQSLLLGGPDASIDRWADAIADTPAARVAISAVIAGAERASQPTLSDGMRSAYLALAAEANLVGGTPMGPPGGDHPPFDPDAVVLDATFASLGRGEPGGLLLGPTALETARDVLLMPLRQLSFWRMKDRARRVGEGGVHDLLAALQRANPAAGLHVMGHSFGCIVASAAVAGAPGAEPVRVGSLYLVQGALSLWSYAAGIPQAPGEAGYFTRILANGLVSGPIVTTRSDHDRAVGSFYVLGARAAGQYVLGGGELPLYGGVGSFGLRGVGAVEMRMLGPGEPYGFKDATVYNLNATAIIRNGGGLSGAHSDIAHDEVAHAFFEAMLPAGEGTAGRGSPGGVLGGGGEGFDPGTGPIGVPPPAGFDTMPSGSAAWASGRPRGRRYGLPLDVGEGSGLDGDPSAEPPRPRGVNGTGGGAPPPPTEADGAGSGNGPPGPGQDASMLEVSPRGHDRWVNATLDGHPGGEPILAGRWYTLMIDVDMVARDEALGSARLGDVPFAPGEDLVELTIQVDGADFDVASSPQPLGLPREGPSPGAARFGVSPRHDGSCALSVTIHRRGNFVQRLDLTFEVGSGADPKPSVARDGRPLSATRHVQPRDVGITLKPIGAAFDCLAFAGVSGGATLPFDQAALARMVDSLRRELSKVVAYRGDDRRLSFQVGVDVPADAEAFALRTMARAGRLLFENIFRGPAAGADSRAIGDFLQRKLVQERDLKLQVVTRGTPIPWSCLYLGDVSAGSTLSWDNFIGLRHVIEQIPLQPDLLDPGPDMPSDRPKLSVSLNVNAGIDAAMGMSVVGDQDAYWEDARARRRVALRRRTTRAELLRALDGDGLDEQVIYFYCHADTVGLDEPGGVDASNITLTDARVSLEDLKLEAPTTRPMRAGPLVFLNACESAALSPAFYDGFVPYFMAKGARGVVGTECNTPALFAREWASAFFDGFLGGAPVGDLFLDLRRRFLDRHRNPLGLLYAVHCDGDVRIAPAPV